MGFRAECRELKAELRRMVIRLGIHPHFMSRSEYRRASLGVESVKRTCDDFIARLKSEGLTPKTLAELGRVRPFLCSQSRAYDKAIKLILRLPNLESEMNLAIALEVSRIFLGDLIGVGIPGRLFLVRAALLAKAWQFAPGLLPRERAYSQAEVERRVHSGWDIYRTFEVHQDDVAEIERLIQKT